jgi:hypothetical protein
MTKRNLLLLLLIFIMVIAVIILRMQEPQKVESSSVKDSPDFTSSTGRISSPQARKVSSLPPVKEAQSLPSENVQIAHQISPHWEEELTEQLKSQGGSSLKEVKVKKIDSVIWKQHNLTLQAESVIVSLKNKQGEEVSFRAMVDSQTGKILESWDRPVVDPLNPREGFGLKLDPRYD